MREHIAAVLADVHGNYPALCACVQDAQAQGAEEFFFLGDYVSDLAQPAQVMQLLHALRGRFPCVFLRGNRERYMLECAAGQRTFSRGSSSGSLLFTYERLTAEDLAFFAALPPCAPCTRHGVSFELAHAAWEDDQRYFDGESDLSPIFAGMKSALLLTAHAHRQYLTRRDGKTILNPGSVGIAMGEGAGTAHYALLTFSDAAVTPQLRRVPYGVEAVLRAQFESGLADYAPCWAAAIARDLMVGQATALRLLAQLTDPADEQQWRAAAAQLGVPLTLPELLTEWKKNAHEQIDE